MLGLISVMNALPLAGHPEPLYSEYKGKWYNDSAWLQEIRCQMPDARCQMPDADLVLPQRAHYMLGLTVRDLRQLRENWNDIEELEYHRLRETSIQESIQQWLQLQQAFEWQLQQTEGLFAEQQRKALIDLQARLHRLVK